MTTKPNLLQTFVQFVQSIGNRTWTDLTGYGENRTNRSSYFWFIFIPICVQLFGHINAIRLPFLHDEYGKPLHLNLALPFSWKLFYVSSILIALATLIFGMRCPSLIRKYPSYAIFCEQSNSGLVVVEEYIKWAALEVDPRSRTDKLTEFSDKFMQSGGTISVRHAANPRTAEHLLSTSHPIQDRLADCFAFTREKLDHEFGWSRFVCGWLFAIGLTIVGYLSFQSVRSVLLFML